MLMTRGGTGEERGGKRSGVVMSGGRSTEEKPWGEQ